MDPLPIIVVAIGDRSVVAPMIEAVGNSSDEDNSLVDALVRLDRRYPLTREPYLSLIVNKIVSEGPGKYGAWWLIQVLQKVTGKSFEDPGFIANGPPYNYEAEADMKIRNILKWCETKHCKIRKTSGRRVGGIKGRND